MGKIEEKRIGTRLANILKKETTFWARETNSRFPKDVKSILKDDVGFKAHSLQICFNLQQLLQRDRKFPISGLLQPTANLQLPVTSVNV